MSLRGHEIAVTGGAGFIGSWICEKLCKDNNVTAIDDLSTGSESNLKHLGNDVKLVRCDVRDVKRTTEVLRGMDTVFHLAANVRIPESIKDPSMDADININGTLNVLEACRKHGISRIVYSSSSSVYGEPSKVPVTEDTPKNPMSPYAVSKLAAELYVNSYSKLYGIDSVSLRYFNVFGPRQNPDSPYSGVISIFVRNLLTGKDINVFGDGGQTRDFVSVRDVAKANVLAASSKKAVGKSINIGTGKSVTLNKVISVLESISDRKVNVRYGEPREGDVRHSMADIKLARDVLSFKPVTGLEDGLRELLGK
jgi:UDP-glucose 4-epimerase